MSDPGTLMEEVHADVVELDGLSTSLDAAVTRLDRAEEAWDEVYDEMAVELKTELDEAGRKGDPAEHTITAATRRKHRATYQELRQAKRNVDRIEKKLQAKRAALNGRQSELGAERDLARAGEGPQPQWTPRAA